MIVTLAFAGPLTQSVSVTGGNFDSAVGPGVGFLVTTVQPESGRKGVWPGTVRTVVGAGRETVEASWATAVAVDVGFACTWGRHPARGMAASIINNKNSLRIRFSEDK